MNKKKHLLVVEPISQLAKGPVIRSLFETGQARLFFAVGVPFLETGWLEPYAEDVFSFSYAADNLAHLVEKVEGQFGAAFDGALTLAEPSVPVVNRLQHRLHLPVISHFLGKEIRSKAEMRDRFLSAGIRQPDFVRIRTAEQLELYSKRVKYPVVVKPTEMMSSLGVFRAENEAELFSAFQGAQTADFRDEHLRELLPDLSNEVLIEEFIEGPEFSVESVVQGGRVFILGITEKRVVDAPYFDEIGHTFPAKIASTLFSKIQTLIERTHHQLQYQNTFTHTEIKLSKEGEPVLIEINSRLGGDHIPTLMEKSLGISIGELLVKVHCGEPLPSLPAFQTAAPVSIHFFTTVGEGRVLSVPSASELPGEFLSYVKPGELVQKEMGLATERLGQVIVPGALPKLSSAIVIEPPLLEKTLPSKQRLFVFEARTTDLEELQKVEREAWDKNLAANPSQIAVRLKNFPGFTLAGFLGHSRKMCGFITTLPVTDFDGKHYRPWSFYAQIAESPAKSEPASVLYVLNISVLPDAPRGVGKALVAAACVKAQTLGLQEVAYGIRLPHFHRHPDLSIQQYYEGLSRGKYHEDLFSLALAEGGMSLGICEKYYDDPKSQNYAIIFSHKILPVERDQSF